MKKFVALALLLIAGPALADDYASDRAQIENLMARYIFALDWQDAEGYAATFTEDGVLHSGAGAQKGRAALMEMVQKLRAQDDKRNAEDKSGKEGKPRARHEVTNIVIDVKGNTARAWAYWSHYNNRNAERSATFDSFGHYEDELVKQNGKWLFKERRVFNERFPARAATDQSPVPKN